MDNLLKLLKIIIISFPKFDWLDFSYFRIDTMIKLTIITLLNILYCDNYEFDCFSQKRNLFCSKNIIKILYF